VILLLLAGVVALVLVGGATYQALAARADRRRCPPSGRLVDIGDQRRIHVHCTGTGSPPVVFEAGMAASSLSWSLVQPRVAAFARACSYDRPGLGWSDPRIASPSARTNAETLHKLLQLVGVPPPCVFVGHSYGTFVIRAYAHRYPDAVAGIVLVDPIYPSQWAQPDRDLQRRLGGGIFLSRVGGLLARVGFVRVCLRLLSGGAPGAARRVARLFGAEAASVLSRLVGEVQKLPPDTWPAVQALWSQPKCFAAMAAHLAALPESARQVAEASHLGDIPLIVITAGHQPAECRAEHERIAALSSRGRQIVLEGGGHWVHLDYPELVADAIYDVVQVARASARDVQE
jgi:pimeloyl-ACP methyl ester carboxylesterase